MNTCRLAAIAALGLLAASCDGSKTPTAATGGGTQSAAPAMADATSTAQAKVGKGTGTVTAIDAAGGKITLDHGPIPEIGWSAMKMTFKAAPAVTGFASIGDKVEFDVRTTGMNSEITALRKR